MNKKFLKNIDWSILISSVILLVIGLIALFSASSSNDYDAFKKQLIFIVIAIPVLIVTILVNYKIYIKLSIFMYVVILALLVGVLFTPEINGANSWFSIGSFTLQPSEFAKIAIVLFFSYMVCQFQKKGRKEINKWWKLSILLFIVAVPILLIVKQPDYGTAMAFIVAIIAILFVAGIDKKYIIVSILLVIILLPIMYFFVLPDHAKSRIEVYLNPYSDPRGAGYNIIQSKLAIGSGELFGMGILNGNQTQLGYLYPKTTDFIFAVISEEMGFIVASIVIITYVYLLLRMIKIAKETKDLVASYIVIGIIGIFAFHMIQNIGMTMGLLPITGVPLLFLSYGGSSLLTSTILVGVVLNIGARKNG